jgi:hypothetical protein
MYNKLSIVVVIGLHDFSSMNVAKSIVHAPPPPPPPGMGYSDGLDDLPNLIGNPMRSFK